MESAWAGVRREDGNLRLLDAAIYEMVSENLLGINLSRLIPDPGRLNQGLELQLQDSLGAFQFDGRDGRADGK
jgi:hypothetical protein